MAGLSASAMLTAWEAGAGASPLDRALGLLWAAGHRGDLAGWPLADRDRALLDLRIASFGTRAELLANCPDCGAELELSLHLPDIRDSIAPAQDSQIDGIRLRALTSRDLAAVATLPEADIPAALCARLADRPVAEVPVANGPMEDGRAADSGWLNHLETREAEAQITLRMCCAECGADWVDPWDIPAHLWSEVEAASTRLMADIADLARAFGWSEPEILALSPARRARYLSLARLG